MRRRRRRRSCLVTKDLRARMFRRRSLCFGGINVQLRHASKRSRLPLQPAPPRFSGRATRFCSMLLRINPLVWDERTPQQPAVSQSSTASSWPAIVPAAVWKPSDPGRCLPRLESPTRSLLMEAPKGIQILAEAGDIQAICRNELRLESKDGEVSRLLEA